MTKYERQPELKAGQHRNVFFTNHDEKQTPQEFIDLCRELGFGWARAQREKCPTTGKLHIQGVAGSGAGGKKFRIVGLRATFPHGHFERVKFPYSAWEYCGKEESRVDPPVSYGAPPPRRNCAGDTKKFNELCLTIGTE